MIILTNAATLRGKIAPLYHRYSSKAKPQDAYLDIYPDLRRVWAEWDSGAGANPPEAVLQRRVLRINLSPDANGDVLADFLESSDTVALFERICAGHAMRLEGTHRVGRLNSDALAALLELEARLRLAFPRSDQSD